eukprot:CCRYP_013368-RA/>CCRYP_013368-RA protein AED:0.45 eAED:0.72 QI:0/0/0/1/0/0/2/0/69
MGIIQGQLESHSSPHDDADIYWDYTTCLALLTGAMSGVCRKDFVQREQPPEKGAISYPIIAKFLGLIIC